MRNTCIAFVAISFAALAGCQEPDRVRGTAQHTSPLIGGTIAEEDPAVVALTTGGSSSFCTGTLISPSVILTAAHCIDMAGADPNFSAFFGTDLSGVGSRVGIGAKKQNLDWDGQVGANDIGLLLLNFAQDPFLPVRLNTSPTPQHVGEPYRHIGFGVFDRDTQQVDGKKREGTTTITGTQSPDITISGDSTVSVCFGDSGGPGMLTVAGVEYVAGIHSFTSGSDCQPPNGDTRVDVYVDDFILPWIQDNDPACGSDGTCAPIGCVDDPDCTPCGADGTCTDDDCALPDPDCPTSAVGEICQANSQCETGLCVFWPPDETYHFCSEECGGDGDCPSGMSCQTIAPFGKICYYDEDPPGVLGDECEQATDCGSYICADGHCSKECDLGAGMGCPEAYSCDTLDGGDSYLCIGDFDDGGGCGCAAQGGRAALGTGLILALGVWLALACRRRS